MKNIRELRSALADVFKNLQSGSLQPAVACELNNSAGKMIGTCKVELEYAALCKVKPSIPFLE